MPRDDIFFFLRNLWNYCIIFCSTKLNWISDCVVFLRSHGNSLFSMILYYLWSCCPVTGFWEFYGKLNIDFLLRHDGNASCSKPPQFTKYFSPNAITGIMYFVRMFCAIFFWSVNCTFIFLCLNIFTYCWRQQLFSMVRSYLNLFYRVTIGLAYFML